MTSYSSGYKVCEPGKEKGIREEVLRRSKNLPGLHTL